VKYEGQRFTHPALEIVEFGSVTYSTLQCIKTRIVDLTARVEFYL